jgi:putative spermidine/putrescine transport system permease protein
MGDALVIRWLRPVLALLLVGQFILPLLLLALTSVSRGWFFPALLPPELDRSAWVQALPGGGRLGRAGVASLGLAAGTAVLATAVGAVAGRALARLRGWRLHLATGAAFLPVAAPPVALATGLQVLLLKAGLAGHAGGVLVAHLTPAAGYLTLYFLGVFAVWDRQPEEEARTVGATPLQVVRHVLLPMLRPALATSLVLGFLISWAQVPLTLVIGAGAVITLPLEVFAYARAGQDAHAAAGALLLMVPPLVLMAWARRMGERTDAVAL